MSHRPSESLKTPASELADLVYTNSRDHERITALLSMLGMSNVKEPLAVSSPSETDIERVAIWNKVSANGEQNFVRDKKHPEWYLWADVDVIPAKSSKKRILLLGESVARGFFYDPKYNPGGVLDSILKSYDRMECEVVDLARTSLRLNILRELCKSSMLLKPDLLICFAGNNWLWDAFGTLDKNDLCRINGVIDEKDYPALKKMLETKAASLVTDFVSLLREISDHHNVPIVFIIPEYNLLDWKSSEIEKVTPLIRNGQTYEWIKLKMSAEKALANGDIDLAAICASKMTILDDSKHPYSLELLARCKMKKGLLEEARMLLEEAKDTALFGRITSKPRMLNSIREALKQNLTKQGISFIDVAELFKNQFNGELPGKELFLDYCHLTSVGIQLVMKHTAKLALSILSNTNVSVDQLSTADILPDKDVEAYAYLLAAIHNAHSGQAYDNVYYYANKAACISPCTLGLMVYYIDIATRKSSNLLCESHERFVESEAIKQFKFEGGTGIMHANGQKLFDIDLVDAMVDILKKFGIEKDKEIQDVRKSEHGVMNGPVNLLEPCYRMKSYDKIYGGARAFYQARDISSSFFLIADKDSLVQFQITYRLPEGEFTDTEIRICVNGERIVTFDGTTKWVTKIVTAPTSSVKDGVNLIVVEWPVPLNLRSNSEHIPGPSMAMMLVDKIYPVFGEIHTFYAIPGGSM